MSTLVIDQKLRPAVEGYSAGVSLMTASVAFTAPWALMMPPLLGAVTGVIATGFGFYRAKQAWGIINYRYGLKNYKITRLHPHRIASRIPKGEPSLYLGEGFAWGQEHTQRKMDASSPDAQPFLKPSWRFTPLLAPARRFEAWTARAASTSSLAAGARVLAHFTAQTAPWNPIAPREDLGGSAILHGVEPREKPVLLRKKMRNGHMLVLGTTRVGKTRLLELLATQDIHAGAVTIIIDPKGDADLMMRVHAEAARSGRLEQLYLFHLGYPDISARYNGIGAFSRVTEVAQRATNGLPSSGNSAAFKEFSWRFTNLVAQAQVALGRVPTYELILRDITNIEPLFVQYAFLVLDRYEAEGKVKGWRDTIEKYEDMLEGDKKERRIAVPRAMQDRQARVIAAYVYVKEIKLPDPVLDGLATAVAYDRSFFEKIIASLGPFLEKLTTGAVGKLLSPDYFDPTDKRPIFDWMTVIRQNGIVYVGLDALSDAVIAGAVGNSMLADLVSVGGKLYKEGTDPHHPEGRITLPNVCCHFDEVNEIAGPEFVPMVNKMGGSGFAITAYTQTIPDIEAKVGDRAKASQILGNFNHVCMLRVKSQETAKFFTDQLPRVDIFTLTAVSGVTDTAADGMGRDFISNNQDRVGKTKEPTLEPSDIMQLPQGQAFALLEGNRLFKIRIPLPDASADAFIPQSVKAIGDDMRARYRSSEQWATETDWLAQHPIGLTQPVVRSDALGALAFPQPEDDDVDELPQLADLGPFPFADAHEERAA
jgi:conjugative coupling factor TraD (TOL family)